MPHTGGIVIDMNSLGVILFTTFGFGVIIYLFMYITLISLFSLFWSKNEN